jgi:hypothetical protein
MNTFFFLTPVVILGFAVAGCSSSSAGNADSGPSAEQACTDSANAYCAQLSKCSEIAVGEDYGSVGACVSGRTTLCENSLAAPGTGATPTTTEACVAAYPTYSCADFENGNTPPACRPQLGTGATGAACAFAAQCQSAFCQIAKGSACGTCQAAPSSGSSCATSNCPTGLHCAASTETCVTYGAANDPCTDNGDCGYELDCVGAVASTGTQGKCMAEVQTAGAACDHDTKTGPGCAPNMNLFCGKDDKCDAYGTAASNQPCAYVADAGTYTYCTGGASCMLSAPGIGVCAGPAANGAACDTAADDGCIAPATCIGTVIDGGVMGTCQLASATSCH